MATYLYTRVSTGIQDTQNQVSRLKELYPDATIIEEVASGGKARPELEKLVQQLQPGDTVIVSALDRLGRRASEILLLVEKLDSLQVKLKSLREDIDFSSAAGRLIFQVMAAVGELEKRLISERTKAALAAKKKNGVRLGRPNKYSTKIKQKVISLRRQGKTMRSISEELSIPVPSLQYLLKE